MFTSKFKYPLCFSLEEDSYLECQVGNYTIRAVIEDDEETNAYDFIGEGERFDPEDWVNGKENKALILAWKYREWGYCGITVFVTLTESGYVLPVTAKVKGLEVNLPGGNHDHLNATANTLLQKVVALADEMIAVIKALPPHKTNPLPKNKDTL